MYLKKLATLLKNPAKARHIPSFLNQQFFLWRGLKKAEIGDEKCWFSVSSKSEYSRINGFKNEEDIIKMIMNELEAEDVFYDVGANIGTHSCFAGKTGAKVYSFEPFPKNTDSLRENIALNSIDGKVFEVALMNQNTKMALERESNESGEGEISVSQQGSIETEVRRGDDLIREEDIRGPDIIKIDVEGAEFEVLKGLENTLNTVRVLFIEIHSDISDSSGKENEIRDFLKEKGFIIDEIEINRGEKHIKAENQKLA